MTRHKIEARYRPTACGLVRVTRSAEADAGNAPKTTKLAHERRLLPGVSAE
jgi:hypothetical protein